MGQQYSYMCRNSGAAVVTCEEVVGQQYSCIVTCGEVVGQQFSYMCKSSYMCRSSGTAV